VERPKFCGESNRRVDLSGARATSTFKSAYSAIDTLLSFGAFAPAMYAVSFQVDFHSGNPIFRSIAENRGSARRLL
jgi:hypothetical protein